MVPICFSIRRVKRPRKELCGVIESEFTLCVLNIVILEEIIKLIEFFLIIEIHCYPAISWGKRIWLFLHFIKSLYLNRLIEFVHFHLLKVFGDWLGEPEVVFVKERYQFAHFPCVIL